MITTATVVVAVVSSFYTQEIECWFVAEKTTTTTIIIGNLFDGICKRRCLFFSNRRSELICNLLSNCWLDLANVALYSHDPEAGAKTLSGRRPIRIDEQTMKALEDHRKAALEKQMENAHMFEDHGLVVHTKFGGPVSPRNVNRSFKRLIEKADIKDIRFHDLRHTYVTFIIKNRETPQAIAERLGWSDTRMIDKYAHIRPDIKRMLRILSGKFSTPNSYHGTKNANLAPLFHIHKKRRALVYQGLSVMTCSGLDH